MSDLWRISFPKVLEEKFYFYSIHHFEKVYFIFYYYYYLAYILYYNLSKSNSNLIQKVNKQIIYMQQYNHICRPI